MGKGNLDLDGYISRGELADIALRLLDLEEDLKDLKAPILFEDVDEFEQVTYVEMLTVFMRILGYEDGLDFVKFPDDYYIKAIEIGLGDLYKDMNQKVTRGEVALTIEKLLDLPLKGKDITILETSNNRPKKSAEGKIRISNRKFNTSITGMFAGQLKGRDDFSKYRVELVSAKDRSGNYLVYGEAVPSKDGVFKIWNFDISWTARFRGYEYRIFDEEGNIVLEGRLK